MPPFSVPSFKNTYASCPALPAYYISVNDCCQSVKTLNIIKCQLDFFIIIHQPVSLLSNCCKSKYLLCKQILLWRGRQGQGQFFLTLDSKESNYSCVSSWLEKLENGHWFISSHDSDIIPISETNRINEESSDLSQCSLAIVQLEETVRTPEIV